MSFRYSLFIFLSVMLTNTSFSSSNSWIPPFLALHVVFPENSSSSQKAPSNSFENQNSVMKRHNQNQMNRRSGAPHLSYASKLKKRGVIQVPPPRGDDSLSFSSKFSESNLEEQNVELNKQRDLEKRDTQIYHAYRENIKAKNKRLRELVESERQLRLSYQEYCAKAKKPTSEIDFPKEFCDIETKIFNLKQEIKNLEKSLNLREKNSKSHQQRNLTNSFDNEKYRFKMSKEKSKRF